MLSHAHLFELLAEIAAAFVGFSLVIGLLQPDDPRANVRLTMMRAVAELAMICAGGSLLVLILHEFGVSPDWLWRAASVTVLVIWLTLHTFAVRRMAWSGSSWFDKTALSGGPTFAMCGMAVLVFNGVIPTAYASQLYVVALTCALVASAFLFIVATFDRLSPNSDSGDG